MPYTISSFFTAKQHERPLTQVISMRATTIIRYKDGRIKSICINLETYSTQWQSQSKRGNLNLRPGMQKMILVIIIWCSSICYLEC